MVERKVASWVDGQPIDLQRDWRSWEQLPDSLKVAVIAGEDQHFAEHHGFDLPAIQQALAHNERGGSIRGASTLSQQVAKNVFLWSGRSWLRKGLEAWFTLLIETLWTKQRILEVYLNSAEWGPGVFGAQAAARYHFGLDAERLSRTQASQLAAVLPSPLKWSAARPGPYAPARGLDSPADVAVGRRRLPAAPGALKAQRGGFPGPGAAPRASVASRRPAGARSGPVADRPRPRPGPVAGAGAAGRDWPAAARHQPCLRESCSAPRSACRPTVLPIRRSMAAARCQAATRMPAAGSVAPRRSDPARLPPARGRRRPAGGHGRPGARRGSTHSSPSTASCSWRRVRALSANGASTCSCQSASHGNGRAGSGVRTSQAPTTKVRTASDR